MYQPAAVCQGIKTVVFTTLLVVTIVFCLGVIYIEDEHMGRASIILSVKSESPPYLPHVSKGGHLNQKTFQQQYNITWYKFAGYMARWPDAVRAGFKSCEYNNCQMWFDPKHIQHSDAVIFDGRNVRTSDLFMRKPGQVWIFSAHEAPVSFNDTGAFWTKGGWVSAFNWTMTYDKSNTDIHLPYGEIRRKTGKIVTKDYGKIFQKKNATALIVYSHCHTRGKRESYVKTLRKYLDIDILGNCGQNWKCGVRFQHDNCFDIVNNYKFYLAFENALCNQYFTEKLFRNYNYDSIMVVRGGRNNDANRLFPKGTFISTEDFKSIKELADYMNTLSKSEQLYTEMLKRKDEYFSFPYQTVYQRAMCDLCERLNHQDKYIKHIKSTVKWAFGRDQCENPSNISDLNETWT